jgi:hypothetical protein
LFDDSTTEYEENSLKSGVTNPDLAGLVTSPFFPGVAETPEID